MRLSHTYFEPNEDPASPARSAESKPVIVILHGLFGSKRNWQSIARRLGEKCRVYTLDLRNHGESEHADEMTYQDMADDVSEFISDHNLGQVSIVGHSMGGKVAMLIGLQNPELINRLVIIDIAPVRYEHGFANLIKSLGSVPLEKISSRQDADEYLKTRIQPQSLRQFLLQNLYTQDHDNHRQFAWRINLKAIQSALDELMDFPDTQQGLQYKNPVLFLKGEKSDYITHQYERRIFKLFPNALFITVEGAGHWLHAENPDFVVSEIGQFIK